MTLAPVSDASLIPVQAPLSLAESLATSRLYRLLDTAEPLIVAAGVVVMTGTVSGTPVVGHWSPLDRARTV